VIEKWKFCDELIIFQEGIILMDKVTTLITFNKMTSFYTKNKALLRFIIVGCINTSIDFFTFVLCNGLFGLDKFISQALGYSMGMANSFTLNKLWSFENKTSSYNILHQLSRFIIINTLSLGVSLLGLKAINDNYGVNIYLSKLMVTAIAQAVNYFGYKLWVFKKGANKNEKI
jgi:putative flippase GtrA